METAPKVFITISRHAGTFSVLAIISSLEAFGLTPLVYSGLAGRVAGISNSPLAEAERDAWSAEMLIAILPLRQDGATAEDWVIQFLQNEIPAKRTGLMFIEVDEIDGAVVPADDVVPLFSKVSVFERSTEISRLPEALVHQFIYPDQMF